MRVSLHIERLVLEGLGMDAAAAARLRASLEAALARQLGEDDMIVALRRSSSRNVLRLVGPRAERIGLVERIDTEGLAATIGEHVARRIQGLVAPGMRGPSSTTRGAAPSTAGGG